MSTLILLNKPFQVLSQFSDREPVGARPAVGARSAGDRAETALLQGHHTVGARSAGDRAETALLQGHHTVGARSAGDRAETAPLQGHHTVGARSAGDGQGSPGGPGSYRATLADYLQAPGFRVAGRLDYDSEGLLLLTDDGQLQQQIANPRHKLWKTYWVQVEGVADDAALARLQSGIELKDGPTLPARVRRMAEPEGLWPRDPPVRQRLTVADSWLEISLREGRNRQVRRMTAAVNLPTLRLIRYRVGDWTLEGLAPGEHRRLTVHRPGPKVAAERGKPRPKSRRKQQ
ncbi:MAG: pseudouridine synthase [Haliea sp.]